jgi:hypothetical protein
MLLNKFEKHKILRSDSRSVVGGRWGCPPPVSLCKIAESHTRKNTLICAGNAAKTNVHDIRYIFIHSRQKTHQKTAV